MFSSVSNESFSVLVEAIAEEIEDILKKKSRMTRLHSNLTLQKKSITISYKEKRKEWFLQ